MHQIEGLFIAESDGKGKGVFTAIDIPINSPVEFCHIIKIPAADLKQIHQTVLHDYYFLWDIDAEIGAIALGFGSLYNHSNRPNLQFELDHSNESINFKAIRDIGW